MISTERSGDVAVVRCSGELDAGAPDLHDALTEALDAGATRVVVDLLEVEFIDSSVVRALLLGQQRTEDAAGWLRVVHSHYLVAKVLDICGVSDVLPRWSSVSAALSSETPTERSS